ncbi:hypothetical protein N480_13575 [Pseudoalteromonas luteoviolacea S2607]|nr:hypothetical protein N480_13575 [Pseudoalteromonas luteoviolacea S2607]
MALVTLNLRQDKPTGDSIVFYAIVQFNLAICLRVCHHTTGELKKQSSGH